MTSRQSSGRRSSQVDKVRGNHQRSRLGEALRGVGAIATTAIAAGRGRPNSLFFLPARRPPWAVAGGASWNAARRRKSRWNSPNLRRPAS